MTTDVTAILITNVTCVTFYIPQGTKATYASHLVLLETSIQGNDHRMGHVAEISEGAKHLHEETTQKRGRWKDKT